MHFLQSYEMQTRKLETIVALLYTLLRILYNNMRPEGHIDT